MNVGGSFEDPTRINQLEYSLYDKDFKEEIGKMLNELKEPWNKLNKQPIRLKRIWE